MTILRLTDSDFVPVEPVDGVLRSTAIVDFTVDPATLYARLSPLRCQTP